MGKRSRACEACHALKIKCEASPTNPGVCERCTRSGLVCVPAARRWQKDRIVELEEQVRSLQEKLDGAGSSMQGLSAYGNSTRATSVLSTGDGEGMSFSMNAVPSGCDSLAFLDARLDHDSQIRCLEVCSATTVRFWSIVPLANGSSARSWLQSARTDTPTTLLALFAFAMSPEDAGIGHQTQEELRRKVLETLGLAAVGLENPSHDLIQAVLVAGFWARPSLDGNHANSIQLVKLAHDLSVELGLGGPAMQSSAPAYFFRIQGPLTLEMKQTWLVSWVASTMAAIGLRRTHAFGWGLSHHDALRSLEEESSSPLFLEILHTVRLHAKVSDALELCDVDSFHDINSDLVTTTQAEVRGRLSELSSRPLAKDPQLRFWRVLATIYANEPVLHTSTNKILFAGPYVAERIGVLEFAHPSKVTGTAEMALRSIVEACQLAIELVLHMEPSLILSLPSLCFGPAVSYALSILVKVFVAVSAPGNTYGRVLTRESLRIREAIDNLMAVKALLLKLDPHMGNWNTRIIGSVEWLGAWLDDYESIIERYEMNLEREVAERAIGSLSRNGHF
ncbi:hypothetical protein B0J13DRAFT_62770 [Dactylonectria estremocensis]|uniref:Zn(2)-C6 fungal-type domain-containing protein n=1 Tax=Dactylonectria estremocensis TaxID=1079267 RepID=A0A9P9EIP0_9HYPO|nr:hypothetical protein B0J13DRAFT_62770 [Dactylonectria estremocensis]